jgi:hypothetical protein
MRDNECPGCGSTPTNRDRFIEKLPEDERDQVNADFMHCPHCDSVKCCMCDMGDDVSCISCEKED